jgi:hypothetical protein
MASMHTDGQPERRLRYYGLNDYATYFDVERAMTHLDGYDETKTNYTINEAIELFNALQFIHNNVFPKGYDKKKQFQYKLRVPKLEKTIATFFNSINEKNVTKLINDVDLEYHQDVLSIMARYKVYSRVSAPIMLRLIKKSHVGVYSILSNKDIVQAYDNDIRTLILADPKNTEYVIQKYLEADSKNNFYLPASFTPNDAHKLLDAYVESGDANPNYLKLIASSRVNKDAGLDAKLKLKAKKKHEASTNEFFEKNPHGGMTFGCEVKISDTQTEPLEVSQNDGITTYSYSRKYLETHSSPPSVISNFISLFGFVYDGMILTSPSYHAELGIFERFMGVQGKDFYPTGVSFQFREQSALVQTLMYENFLRSNNMMELEQVISWFFSEYLKNKFGIKDFKYTPSSKGSTYLEKSRHVFTETESVIKQFTLYVENGEMDKELLAITSEQVRYASIPSLIPEKYVYVTNNQDIALVQHSLFSDQSGLCYINDTLKADDFAKLLLTKDVKYSDFLGHQKPTVDKLIDLGVLKKAGSKVQLRSLAQFAVLRSLFDVEAVSYYHCEPSMQSEINDMVQKDWLVRESSLLTKAEAAYFNYYLNQKDFSNGLDLRNRYLHGSQANTEDENEHYKTYITALKLLMSLVIKMNSDFLLNSSKGK